MDRQHDLNGLSVVQAKKPFQNHDDKFHGGVVVIKQQHLIHRRTLRLWFGCCDDGGLAIGAVIVTFGQCNLERCQNEARFKVGRVAMRLTIYVSPASRKGGES